MSDVIDINEWADKHGRGEQESFPDIDIHTFTLLVEEITALLKTMPGPKKTQIKAMYAEMVGNYSDQQIIDTINHSNETQWRKKPMFYSAIIDETRLVNRKFTFK